MKERRGPWFLITGVLIGLVIGLFFAYFIVPVRYVDTTPQTMGETSRTLYRSMVALAYQFNGDMGRASARLALLQDANLFQSLTDQAKQVLANDGPPNEAKSLAKLAADLQSYQATGKLPSAAPVELPSATNTERPTATPETGTVIFTATPQPGKTAKPAATFTAMPTRAQPTLGAVFTLADKKKICDAQKPALLQVEVRNHSDVPVAGMAVMITWNGGENTFYTGLYPLISPGYADLQMATGTVYSLRVGEAGEVVADLRADDCKASDGTIFPGGWKLLFTQP